MFSVRILNSAGAMLMVPPALTLSPSRWTAAAVGGPVDADIDVTGAVDVIGAALPAWLGARLEIWNEQNGVCVWWGDIVEMNVTSGAVERGLSLREMANRVRVRYQQIVAGGAIEDDQVTTWAENAASIARYGSYDLILTPSEPLTSTQATALRDATLANRALPVATLRMVGEGAAQHGRLICAGYYERLARRYIENNQGLVEYTDGQGEWPVGCGFTSIDFGFHSSTRTIHEVGGSFYLFQPGWKVRISGAFAGSNNQSVTVKAVSDQNADSYTANTISFDPNDDVIDSAKQLDFIAEGEVFLISGSTSNDGKRYCKIVHEDRIEISPGWGGVLTSEAAGATITLSTGNHIVVEEKVSSERSSVSITAMVWGRKLYQTFTLPNAGTWTANQIELYIKKSVPGGTQDLTIQLVEDSSGEPGTVLETVTLYDTEVPENDADWVTVQLANTTALTYGTTYGIVLDENEDYVDFFLVGYDKDAGSAQGLAAYDGADWNAVDGKMQFRILGGVDTATQIGEIVTAADVGLLVDVQNTSGLVEHQYRDDTVLASDVISGLLAQGDSSDQRMLAQVSAGLSLRVYTQPASTSIAWMLRDDGSLATVSGSPAPAGLLPVGVWVALEQALALDDWGRLSPFFVERAEYSVANGLTLEPQNQRELWELTE